MTSFSLAFLLALEIFRRSRKVSGIRLVLSGQAAGFLRQAGWSFCIAAALGGGQEPTALAAMSTLAHHRITFVPLGYKPVFSQ